jgi:hypothetical protein
MLYGQSSSTVAEPVTEPFIHPPRERSGRRVAIVMGYPASDAPLLQYALEKTGVDVDVFDRTWLPAEGFKAYELVAILGSTVRANMQPSGFASDEHKAIQEFFDGGGTLLVGRELMGQLFPGDPGREFVESIVGNPKPAKPVACASSRSKSVDA